MGKVEPGVKRRLLTGDFEFEYAKQMEERNKKNNWEELYILGFRKGLSTYCLNYFYIYVRRICK